MAVVLVFLLSAPFFVDGYGYVQAYASHLPDVHDRHLLLQIAIGIHAAAVVVLLAMAAVVSLMVRTVLEAWRVFRDCRTGAGEARALSEVTDPTGAADHG